MLEIAYGQMALTASSGRSLNCILRLIRPLIITRRQQAPMGTLRPSTSSKLLPYQGLLASATVALRRSTTVAAIDASRGQWMGWWTGRPKSFHPCLSRPLQSAHATISQQPGKRPLRLTHCNISLRREANMVPETMPQAFKVERLPQECSLSTCRCRPVSCRYLIGQETASGTSWTGKVLPSKAWRTTIHFSPMTRKASRVQLMGEIQSWEETFRLPHERPCLKFNPHSPWAWPSMEREGAANAAHPDSSIRWCWRITPIHRHKSAMMGSQVRPYPASRAMPRGSAARPPGSIARSRTASGTIKSTR